MINYIMLFWGKTKLTFVLTGEENKVY